MDILLLHALEEPLAARRTTFNQTFCLPKYAAAHNYVLHCHGRDPIDRVLVDRRFDVIVLDTTFLCLRWVRPRRLLDDILQKYDFVRRSSALKLAFPQDDYDHNRVLDTWLSDWGVGIIFSPLARFKDVLYPMSMRTAEVLECLTGHVDCVDELIFEHWRKELQTRSIDIGWRAKKLPGYFGRIGALKSEIGERFMKAVSGGRGLRLDISNRADKTLLGTDWLRFLCDCKFTLGSISGSSLLDPDGAIQDRVRQYERRHPHARFQEIERACFPGLDGVYEFAALGPRNLEAAMAMSCQILVGSPHWAPLKPDHHFIELEPDCANVDRVLAEMADRDRVEERIGACYDLLVRSGRYSHPAFVESILKAIDRATSSSDASHEYMRVGRHPDIVETLLGEQRVIAMSYQNAAEREAALRRQVAVRTGRRGALREFFRANEYAEYGPSERGPLMTRLFFGARRVCTAVERRIRKRYDASSGGAGGVSNERALAQRSGKGS
jgi:hypothetical protein